jgi:xanthine dehydrogenase YagS FAD-binding subunit
LRRTATVKNWQPRDRLANLTFPPIRIPRDIVSAFTYHRETALSGALSRLAVPGQIAIGGGTDLLVTIEEGLVSPDGVVDVRSIAESLGISEQPTGWLRIGGACRLDDIAHDESIRQRYALLASACEQVGTPAIRAMATLAGNLAQRPRCWYFRRGVSCHKTGGTTCPARDGENQYLAILEGGPCWIVHPSDPAVALVALDAEIDVDGPSGPRVVAAGEFFVLPTERMDRETVLQDGELIVAVRLPAVAAGGMQRYTKLMQREAWDFALVSLAATRRNDGEVRLVLGGVAPRPYRVYTSVEEEAMSGGLDEETIVALAERALLDAEPLSKNGYKLALAATLLRDAIREIATE